MRHFGYPVLAEASFPGSSHVSRDDLPAPDTGSATPGMPSAESAASPSGTGFGAPSAGWSGASAPGGPSVPGGPPAPGSYPVPGGYPAWGGYPGWSQPALQHSRRVHVGWLIAAILITAVTVGSVAAGAGYIVGRHQNARAAAGQARGTGGLAPPASGGGVGGCTPQLAGTEPALTSLFVPVPPGAGRDGSLPFTQALSLSRFVSAVYQPRQHQAPVLSGLCFQAAARQAYLTASAEIVVTYLIRFGGGDNAKAYTLRTISGDRTEKGNTTSTAVPGVTDGTIICRPSLDKYGNTLCHVLAVRGNIAILMHVYRLGKLPDQRMVEALLRRQFARL